MIEYSRELRPLFRYINELCACTCFPDLLVEKVFPDAKEMTESCASYNAVRHKLPLFALNDSEVTMISVGDGNTPRTASLFAFRSAWQCVSIDPRLKRTDYPRIKRLTCIKSRVEDCEPRHYNKLVITAVHSHAKLENVIDKFTADEGLIVAMPCCVRQETGHEPAMEYRDGGVWSPHNLIKIWRI